MQGLTAGEAEAGRLRTPMCSKQQETSAKISFSRVMSLQRPLLGKPKVVLSKEMLERAVLYYRAHTEGELEPRQ